MQNYNNHHRIYGPIKVKSTTKTNQPGQREMESGDTFTMVPNFFSELQDKCSTHSSGNTHDKCHLITHYSGTINYFPFAWKTRQRTIWAVYRYGGRRRVLFLIPSLKLLQHQINQLNQFFVSL